MLGILEVGDELGDGVGGDDGVGVDADVDLFVHAVEGEVEGGGLASVGLGEHLEAAGGDLGGVGLAGHFGGAVAGAVVDDDDVQVLVVGVEHRADGADDDRLFVVGGDEDGDAGIVAGRGQAVRPAQAVDDGEDADERCSRALIRMSPTKKTRTMNLPTMAERGEGDGVGQRCAALPEGERRHDLGGGLAHQRGDRDDGVAVGAQGVNEHGQGGHGGGAVAAAVVQQDDGAAELRLGLHGRNWSRTDWVISAGVLRGCSFQSSVSILLPMMM